VETSTLQVEVEDAGSGVAEAQAISIFRDRGLSNIGLNGATSIGLHAVRTHMTGLGGSVGANGSTFWLKLPVREEPMAIHPVTLEFSENAEKGFREYYVPSVSVMLTSFILYTTLSFLAASMTAHSYEDQWICFDSNLTKYYNINQIYLFNNNNRIERLMYIFLPNIMLGTVLVLRTYYSASYATNSYIYWITNTITHVILLLTELMHVLQYFNEMKNNYVGLFTAQYGFLLLLRPVILTPMAGFVLKHTWLLFIVPFMLRSVLAVLITNERSSLMRLTIVSGSMISIVCLAIVWYIERSIRINYRNGFQHRSLKRDRQMLERVARVRGAEVQEEAETNAAHEVTGCFNTLLTAALEMQGFLDKQALEVKEREKKERKNRKKRKKRKKREETNRRGH